MGTSVNRKIDYLHEMIENCSRCGLSRTRKNAIQGEGPLDARVMLVAQAPGRTEDIEGRMFIGPSGKILDSLLDDSGVSREKIYMTNLVKCMLPRYRKPKMVEIDACSFYLNKEIIIVNPSSIVGLGFYASRYLLDMFEVKHPQSKEEFRYIYGKLFLSGEKRILPLHHPAALLHNESLRDILKEEYRIIKALMSDCEWYSLCPMKRFTEKGLLDRKWIQLYCLGNWKNCARYELEEKMIPHPDNMLPDGSVNENLK